MSQVLFLIAPQHRWESHPPAECASFLLQIAVLPVALVQRLGHGRHNHHRRGAATYKHRHERAWPFGQLPCWHHSSASTPSGGALTTVAAQTVLPVDVRTLASAALGAALAFRATDLLHAGLARLIARWLKLRRTTRLRTHAGATAPTSGADMTPILGAAGVVGLVISSALV